MKTEMTEKDKKLLMILAIFVIVVCIGYWGIMPTMDQISAINEETLVQQDLQTQNEMKIMELPMIVEDNKSYEEKILKARKNYYDVMTSDEVDKYFTGMALDYDLYAYDLVIDMPDESTTTAPYQYSEKAEKLAQAALEAEEESTEEEPLSNSEESLEEIGEAEEDEEEEEMVVDNGIYMVTVTQRLGGSKKKCQKLINDLSNSKEKVRVVSYTYSTTDELVGNESDYKVKSQNVLELTVEIYMCAATQEEEIEDGSKE
ncbi:MAG: hypothetical protein K6G62_04935 [Eubacterium sp.]|nr:hypothetical protein [Eubacterium sp.]